MENNSLKRFPVLLALLSFSIVITAAAGGCTVPTEVKQPSLGLKQAMKSLPPAVEVKILIVVMLEGTQEQSQQAETKLKEELGHAALPWIGAALEEEHPRNIQERLTDIMVAILLKDASSQRDEYRVKAISQLVNLDKKQAIIDQLLLRLEEADQRLSNSIFQVLEQREYISGDWSWPEQAWEELSARFADNENMMKRYITYRLSSIPSFNTRTMNWDEYDAQYDFTVLSELARGEHYSDLAPVFAGMLDADAPRIRRNAVAILGHFSTKSVAEKLAEMAGDDPSTNVRAAAAEALGRMRAEEEASTALVVLLRKGELLGSNVCWALGEMRSQKAVSALIQLVEKEPAAMLALGKIGNELAVRPLVRVLEASSNMKMKITAVRALGYFNTSDALQALKRAHMKELAPDVKREMLFAIFKMEPEDNKAEVRKYVVDWDETVRLTAMTLLLSKGYQKNISIPAIMELIDRQDPDRRAWFWDKLKNSFEKIPEYHPYGLTHRRAADVKTVSEWYTKNKINIYWDESIGKYKAK